MTTRSYNPNTQKGIFILTIKDASPEVMAAFYTLKAAFKYMRAHHGIYLLNLLDYVDFEKYVIKELNQPLGVARFGPIIGNEGTFIEIEAIPVKTIHNIRGPL